MEPMMDGMDRMDGMDGGAEMRMSERLLYTIEGARQMLGGLAWGVIRSVKIGRRRMIARRDLEEYVERLRDGAA